MRSVNWNNAMVLNENGTIMGPYRHEEWLEHSYYLWDLFHKLKSQPELFLLNQSYYWSTIYFRHNDDFCAGLYQRFTPIFMLLARFLPDEYSRHRSYADVHSGADLWENIKPVDKEEAVNFRQHGKMFNVSVPHDANLKIRGQMITDVMKVRANEKKKFKSFVGKVKKNQTDFTDFVMPAESQFESWYRPLKNLPKRLVNGLELPAIFPNNERHILEHWDTCVEGIEKFLKSGAIQLMPLNYTPKLVATHVLANADNPDKKTRPCYDGGSFKILEAFKTSCKLEGLPQILNLVLKGKGSMHNQYIDNDFR